MSDETKYQEGVLVLSDGTHVPFLCRPISEFVADDKVEEVGVSDIMLFPEVDRAEEVKDEILKDKLDNLPDSPESPENNQSDVEDKIEGGLSWDDAY